ncbi:MAG: hypothetical protein AMXMBFR83_04090 [Phycisphaerae bacterium]
MAADSSIEWTQMTWNPVTGCTKVSEGCRHCYAERMARRLQARVNGWTRTAWASPCVTTSSICPACGGARGPGR